MTKDELQDLIAEAISDSLDMDWSSRDGARSVMAALEKAGWPNPKERGTDCIHSPTGYHQVDTSMESGPNNCFYCERPMP